MPSYKFAAVCLRHGMFCALASLSLVFSPLAVASTTLTISGTPPTTATLGKTYSFTPTATAPSGQTLRFTIYDMPYWATFNHATGQLSGTPTIPGTYHNIVVGVTNGVTRVSLPAFSITASKSTSSAVTISGTPPTTATVAQAYSFRPTATAPSGSTLSFSISNKPSWGSFSSTTGQLSGTPTMAGSYSSIVISATNGLTKASLPAFTINVGTALPPSPVTISWMPPTTNTNGSTLTNLAGYHLYYGTTQTNLSNVVKITNPGITSYVLSNLSPATWYFSMSSVNSSGVEGPRSAVVSHVVQ